MARKQTKRQKAALKGWATRRARDRVAKHVEGSRAIIEGRAPQKLNPFLPYHVVPPSGVVYRSSPLAPLSWWQRLVRGWFP